MAAGPYYGPKGGKWKDPQHTQAWKEEVKTGKVSDEVKEILADHVRKRGLDKTISAFNSRGDQTLHLPGKVAVKASALAAEVRSWKPKPIPKGVKLVTVHHSTRREDADQILKDGVIPQIKPWTLASRRYAAGERAEFSPGAGIERGVYVAEEGSTEGFGQVTLAFTVPVSWLRVPAELRALGHGNTESDAEGALKTEHGAYISEGIPPSAIQEVTRSASKSFAQRYGTVDAIGVNAFCEAVAERSLTPLDKLAKAYSDATEAHSDQVTELSLHAYARDQVYACALAYRPGFLDLIQITGLAKARTRKYIRKIPTGNPKHPWRYIYRKEAPRGQLALPFEVEPGERPTKTDPWLSGKQSPTGKGLKILSLFSGVGGLDLGMSRALPDAELTAMV